MCWAAANFDEVDGRCGNGTTSGTLATTFSGAFVDDRTEFYWPFFYGSDAARRASTVFHESRHAWGCGHNGGSGCPRGGSCDSSWSNGCSGSGSAGANRFQVSFLSWYANTAWRTTDALRTSAVARGNDVLANGYNNDPCFRLSSNGTTFSSC